MDALAMPPLLVVSKEGGRQSIREVRGPARRPAWRRALRRFAAVQMALLLTLVFFLVLTPLALLRRALGADPLRIRRRPASGFTPRKARSFDGASLERRG